MDTNQSNSRRKKVSPFKPPSRQEKLENFSSDELLGQYNALLEREKQLEKEISAFTEAGVSCDLTAEMQALHKYNEMKDFAQVVLGYLSDVEHTTVTELHFKYNLPTH